ncbi:MAG: DNA polymerase Y family protein [Bryobacteraceae bacterium]|nr:DNA polymerase Y family protein [Bryobacteraceae bacterium]
MYACLHIPNLPSNRHAALVRCAESFSPLIEPAPDRVLADIRGLGSLFGRPQQIAEQMKASLDAAGFYRDDTRVGIAANPWAATSAARGIPGITVITPGDESRALARLPLMFLDPDPELLETLTSWGIHTFGDLSRLPETGLAERLGPEGVRLHMLARGLSPGPLVASYESPEFSSSLELDFPLDSLESLAFLLGRLLNEVCGRLVSNGLAATEVTVQLALENRTQHVRTIRLPYATTDSTSLLKLLQYDLAAHPPQSPVCKVAILAQPSPQRRLQGGLFIPVAPEAEKLELTLARLAAVVGEGNIGSPELLNTHRADAFRMNRFVARPGSLAAAPPLPTATPLLAIRLYRPPIPADVVAPLGYPQRIATARGISGNVISGNVIGYAGPWRTSGDWWRTDSWACDEWDIALQSGALYRISRQIMTSCIGAANWFVNGNYD